MSSAEAVELLGGVPVFSTLVREDLERIAQFAVPRDFDVGEVVFREGDASDTCYIVRELALFEDEKRSATVEAIEPTSTLAVLGPDMRRLMTEHAEISARLVVALGRRLRETNERLARQSFQTVQSRVA